MAIKTQEELLNEFMDQILHQRFLALRQAETKEEAVDQIIIGILSTIDGVSGQWPDPITLVVEPTPEAEIEEIQAEGRSWIEAPTPINLGCYLHDLYGAELRKRFKS
nr:MAG: hypothetical protein [Bacteriophage sp.]